MGGQTQKDRAEIYLCLGNYEVRARIRQRTTHRDARALRKAGKWGLQLGGAEKSTLCEVGESNF